MPQCRALLAQFVELLKQSGKIERRADGYRHVARERNGQQRHQHRQQHGREAHRQHLDRRMDNPRQKHPKKSPAQGRLQADPSLKLESMGRIVPVFYLEQFFHDYADNILKYCCYQHADSKKRRRMVIQRQRNVQQKRSPKAINRQHRPTEKAAVDKAPLLHGNDRGLKAPAQKAVNIKYQHPLQERIIVNHIQPFSIRRSPHPIW